MADSIGLFIRDSYCVGYLTVPQLARAMGIHLGEFEKRIMAEGLPTEEEVRLLAELAPEAIYLRGENPPPVTLPILQKIVAEWSDYTSRGATITEAPWDEPPVVDHEDIAPGTDDFREWVFNRRAFTREAFCATWHGMDVTALGPYRWKSNQETVNGKNLSVWRWNPFDKSVPRGKKQHRFFRPPYKTDPYTGKTFMFQSNLEKVRTYLRRCQEVGKKQVPFQEITGFLFAEPPSNGNTLQNIRKFIRQCGWVYDKSAKVWKLP